MAQHSSLTGASLHEPKGVASAVANRVYVSNGLGSGSWAQLPSAALAGDSNSFASQLFHIAHIDNTPANNGGPFSALSWITRPLTTPIINQISGASLSTNKFSLPTGTYYIDAKAIAGGVDSNQLRIQNTTDAVMVLEGMNHYTPSGTYQPATLFGRFQVSGSTKAYELQHQCQTSNATDGFGRGNGWSPGRFAEVKIWKIG